MVRYSENQKFRLADSVFMVWSQNIESPISVVQSNLGW